MPSLFGRSSRRRSVLLAACGLSAALALSACGSTADDENSADAGAPGPGVSAEEVRVGFITVNAATAGGSGGFEVPDQGDARKQIEALVAEVNAAGGVAGRTVVPVYKEFESSTASPQTEAALCTAFTDDDEVFAVVLTAQRSPATRTCYKNAGALMIETSGNAQGDAVYEDNAPYYWTPAAPTFDTFLETLVGGLQDQEFFAGDAKVGVVAESGPQYESLVADVLKPRLAEAGVTDVTVGKIDQSTPDTAASTTRQVVSDFKSGGVNRVIFAGRADNAGYFTGTALPQKYFPRLAISTFEDPQFSALNPAFFPAEALEGAVGIGIAPTKDFVQDLEWPFSESERACLDTFEQAAITFEDRRNTGDAMRYCDAVRFLKAAGDKVGDAPLNVETFKDAAWGLGEEWQSATNFGTRFAEGVYAPTTAYRELAYVDGEFTYVSDVTPFPED